jgi:hypothetical protein
VAAETGVGNDFVRLSQRIAVRPAASAAAMTSTIVAATSTTWPT